MGPHGQISLALQTLYGVAESAVTKDYSLGGLSNSDKFSDSSGGWRSEIKVPVWLRVCGTQLQGPGWAARWTLNWEDGWFRKSGFRRQLWFPR